MRGVLNKLTPQKFDTLLEQVKALTIDTKERLQGVIDLVFEKAVEEPNFSKAYALMCRELALMQVPSNNSSSSKKDDYVNFRKLLVTRCQLEFEKNSVDETARNCKLKEIEECADPVSGYIQFLISNFYVICIYSKYRKRKKNYSYYWKRTIDVFEENQ